jgi:hypothetical protein
MLSRSLADICKTREGEKPQIMKRLISEQREVEHKRDTPSFPLENKICNSFWTVDKKMSSTSKMFNDNYYNECIWI